MTGKRPGREECLLPDSLTKISNILVGGFSALAIPFSSAVNLTELC